MHKRCNSDIAYRLCQPLVYEREDCVDLCRAGPTTLKLIWIVLNHAQDQTIDLPMGRLRTADTNTTALSGSFVSHAFDLPGAIAECRWAGE
jgi:hypothetical protein